MTNYSKHAKAFLDEGGSAKQARRLYDAGILSLDILGAIITEAESRIREASKKYDCTLKFQGQTFKCTLPELIVGPEVKVPEGWQSLKLEIYREYSFGDRTYRISDPVALKVGTTTHRVLDSKGIVHCVPAPGRCGCVLTWKPCDIKAPSQF